MARAPASGAFDDLDRAQQPVDLITAAYHGGILVDVIVERHLVTAFGHVPDGFRVPFDAPGRKEEGLLDAKALIGLDDARHREPGALARHENNLNPGNLVPWILQVYEAVRVHVEGDRRAHPTTEAPPRALVTQPDNPDRQSGPD